jgi:hypothetical protein
VLPSASLCLSVLPVQFSMWSVEYSISNKRKYVFHATFPYSNFMLEGISYIFSRLFIVVVVVVVLLFSSQHYTSLNIIIFVILKEL